MRMCFAVGALVASVGSTAMGNVLANPGFESGLAGWTGFGNAFAEAANPPAVVPYAGNGVAKMFGNFSGGFNVTGIFQEFATTPGTSWTMDAYSRHFSGDAMVGAGLPNDNWAVMKIAFFDGSNVEIGNAERVILDGTFATDVWHDNLSITGIAPAGTVKLQAFLLYLQPAFAGGAAQFDDVSLVPTPGAATALGLAGVVALRRRRR
jgi:MYXO-CTERM domain-containing protein